MRAESPGAKGRLRWVICGLLFTVTVNNYLDRQIFSVAAPVISAEFGLTASDIASIANAFLVAYAFGQLIAGAFVDWLGARNGLTLAVIAWSITASCTGFARQLGQFRAFQFVLGASEAVNYPGVSRLQPSGSRQRSWRPLWESFKADPAWAR